LAYPTRHWRKIQNTIGAGIIVQIAHGLRDAMTGVAVVPDFVEFEMGVAGYNTWANEQIGKGLADTNTNIFLQNFDGANPHAYSVVVRSVYSEDDVNF